MPKNIKVLFWLRSVGSAQQMPLPKLSDNRSGAIAIQIYTADIKDLIFALNVYELTILVRDYDKFSVVAVDSLLMDISIYDTDTCKTDT